MNGKKAEKNSKTTGKAKRGETMIKVINQNADCSKCVHFQLEGFEGVCTCFGFVIEDAEPMCSAYKPEANAKDGQFIKEWGCISDASRELKINSSNISMCAQHKRRIAGGYRWEYTYYEKLDIIAPVKKSTGFGGKPVLQLDDNGNIIKEYKSLNEAAASLHTHPSNISKVLHGVINKAGGYKWKKK